MSIRFGISMIFPILAKLFRARKLFWITGAIESPYKPAGPTTERRTCDGRMPRHAPLQGTPDIRPVNSWWWLVIADLLILSRKLHLLGTTRRRQPPSESNCSCGALGPPPPLAA